MADQVINFPRDTTLKHANEIQRAIAAGCATPGTSDLCYKHLVAQATTKDEVDSLFIEWWKAQYDSSKYSKVQMLERWFGNVLDDDRVHGCTVPLYATSTSAIGELTDDSVGLVCTPSTASAPGRDDFAHLPQFWCVEVAAEKKEDGSHEIFYVEHIDDLDDVRSGEHLCVALLLGQLAGLDGSSVVATALGEAGQAGSGTDVLVFHVDADGVDALGIVSARGSADDAENVVLGSVHAQTHVVCKHEGTDIQGSTVGMGHPVTVHVHQSFNGLNVVLHRDLGDAQTVGGVLETLCVAVRAEQLDGIIGRAVCLHALKDLLSVVEHDSSRVQFKGAVGDNAGIVPAFALGVIHHEHMVGELLAKTQIALVRLCLRSSGTGDLDIQHDLFSLFPDLGRSE